MKKFTLLSVLFVSSFIATQLSATDCTDDCYWDHYGCQAIAYQDYLWESDQCGIFLPCIIQAGHNYNAEMGACDGDYTGCLNACE